MEDFRKQLQQAKRLGPLSQLLEMVPGMSQYASQISQEDIDRQLKQVEAIINSMTPAERRDPRILNASRRRRIALGSGTDVQDVNNLMRQFQQMQHMMKQLSKQKVPANLKGLFRQ